MEVIDLRPDTCEEKQIKIYKVIKAVARKKSSIQEVLILQTVLFHAEAIVLENADNNYILNTDMF